MLFVSFGLKYQDYNFKRKQVITNYNNIENTDNSQQEEKLKDKKDENKEIVDNKTNSTQDILEQISDQNENLDNSSKSILDNTIKDFEKQDLLDMNKPNDISENSEEKQEDKNASVEELNEIVANNSKSFLEKIDELKELLNIKIYSISDAINTCSGIGDECKLLNIQGKAFLYFNGRKDIFNEKKINIEEQEILRNYKKFEGTTYDEFIIWLNGLTKQTLINLAHDIVLKKIYQYKENLIDLNLNLTKIKCIEQNNKLFDNPNFSPKIYSFIELIYSSFQSDVEYLNSITNTSASNFYFTFLENLNIFSDISDKFQEFKDKNLNIEGELYNNIQEKIDLIKVPLTQNTGIETQNFLFFGISKNKKPIVLTKKDIINLEKKYTFINNELLFKANKFINPHFDQLLNVNNQILKTKTFSHSLVKYLNNKLNTVYFKNPDRELIKIRLVWSFDNMKMNLIGIKIDNIIIPIYTDTKFKLSYLLYNYLIGCFEVLNFRILDILNKIIAEEDLTTDLKTRKLELPKYAKLEINKLEKFVTQKLDQYFKFKKQSNSQQQAIFLSSVNEIFTMERKRPITNKKKNSSTDLKSKLNNSVKKNVIYRDFFYIQSEKGNFYFGLTSNTDSKNPYHDLCVINDDFLNKYSDFEIKLNKFQLNNKDYSNWILYKNTTVQFYEVLSNYLSNILSVDDISSINFNFTKQKDLNILNGFNILIKSKKGILKNINIRVSIVLFAFIKDMKIDINNDQIKKFITTILELENQQRPESLSLDNIEDATITILNNLKNR